MLGGGIDQDPATEVTHLRLNQPPVFSSVYLLLPIYYHILRACNYIFLQNLCILLFKFYVWSCLKYQDINNKAKTYFSCAVVMLCFYKVALSNVVSIAYYAWQCTLCWHNVIGIIKSYLHYDAS